MKRRLTSMTGQALLLAVLFASLLLMAFPIIFYVNSTGATHQAAAARRDKGTALAEEGIAYAVQLLSRNHTRSDWDHWLDSTVNLPPECTNQDITGPNGGQFRLHCDITDARREEYQIYVKSTGYAGPDSNHLVPVRAIEAFLSPRTMAAQFPSGFSASAALTLLNAPQITSYGAGSVTDIEFGPILCNDSINMFYAPTLAITNQRPRLFSSYSIFNKCNVANPPTTDSKSYWAYMTPGFTPVIDTNLTTYSYETASAQLGNNCADPGCIGTTCSVSAPNNCDFTVNASQTIHFGSNYTGPGTNGVIYINGNAAFDQTQLYLLTKGAVIVNGNLTLGSSGYPASGYALSTIRIPPTAHLDDPFNTCTAPFCSNGQIDRHIDFKGFLYVTGDLDVAPNSNWTLDGAVRIDGNLTVGSSATLALYYDDRANHSVRAASFEVMIDSQTEVTVN